MTLIRKLGARCKAIRIKAGFTQQAAAEKAGISIGHVQVVERGSQNPTVAILAALARAYGVPVAELFTGL